MESRNEEFVTGDGRLVDVHDITNLYRDIVSLASPASGRIQKLGENDSYSLTCGFTTTDCDVLESIKTAKSYFVKTASNKNNSEVFIESVRSVTDHYSVAHIAVANSDNGRFIAKIKSPASCANEGANKRQLLEIWDRSKLVRTIDVADVEEHGLITTTEPFASFRWTPFGAQDKLLYVCEKKQLKFGSFFNQKTDHHTSKNKSVNLGDEHNRRDHWGECMEDVSHTILAILDVSNDCKITTIEMENFSLADSRWLEGLKTISVAYPENPKRLGLIYSNNRPSHLVVHDWNKPSDKEVMVLKSDNQGFYQPRVSHSGRRFVYLAAPAHGPHKSSAHLYVYDLDTGKNLVQHNPINYFMEVLSDNCFSSDDRHILFVSTDHLYRHMCLYSLDTGTVSKIKFPTTGLNLLDFRHNIILASGSEVNATPTLFVSLLNSVDSGELVAWHQIEDCIHLEDVDYETYQIPTSDRSSTISAYLVSPLLSQLKKNFVSNLKQIDADSVAKTEYDLPTVVLVHGGPHSAFMVEYVEQRIFYARLGLRTLAINYRGSTGVSEDYSKQLCGRVGEMDIEDCLQAIRFLVQNKVINRNKLIIQGGSHGGFIACHLSCQQEFKFSSAILRNPVVDISSLSSTSDMPDWSYCEVLNLGTYEHNWIPDCDQLAQMYRCSPLYHYQNANVPTVLFLGTEDKRVNMYQGERWFHLLRARGIKAQCKVYADKHNFLKITSITDSNITSIMWILSNLMQDASSR